MARPYDSKVRSQSAEATRDRILQAAIELAMERRAIDMTLAEVAGRAGTTVQTVLRKFGSRDGLIEAAAQVGSAQVAAERRSPGDDVDQNVRLLVEHYERRGEFALTIQAVDEPWARAIAASGRLLHRDWVEQTFAASLPLVDRAELIDLLVVATDVYAWKLLRLDRGLDADTVTNRIRRLTQLILKEESR